MIVLVFILSFFVPANTQSAPTATPVVETGELMDLFLEPLYQELKQALEKPPQNRKDWAAIYRAAVRLAEADNLLFFRAPGRYTSDEAWARSADAARQAAADIASATFVALRSARPESYEPLKARLTQVADTCNACHRALRVDAKLVKP